MSYIRRACLLVFCSILTTGVALGSQSNASIDITNFDATPNPAAVGASVDFSAVVTHLTIQNVVGGSLDFGDGTFADAESATMKGNKGVITHTYSKAGVYAATLTVDTTTGTVTCIVYVIVGRGVVVNPTNGIAMQLTDQSGNSRDVTSRFSNGVVDLNVFPSRAGGTSAQTDFGDGSPVPSRGISVSHQYKENGIWVATSTATNGTTAVGTARKMCNISSRDVNASGALADPADSNITVKKLTGKINFNSPKPDNIMLSCTVHLPTGFNAALDTPLFLGLGNLVDGVTVDAKGKLKGTSKNGVITKLKVKYPKSGDLAQIDATLRLAGASSKGLDTEGITPRFRSDEVKLKQASRQIQLDIQLAGVPYEGLAPVMYKLSKPGAGGDASAGQFNGRKIK